MILLRTRMAPLLLTRMITFSASFGPSVFACAVSAWLTRRQFGAHHHAYRILGLSPVEGLWQMAFGWISGEKSGRWGRGHWFSDSMREIPKFLDMLEPRKLGVNGTSVWWPGSWVFLIPRAIKSLYDLYQSARLLHGAYRSLRALYTTVRDWHHAVNSRVSGIVRIITGRRRW